MYLNFVNDQIVGKPQPLPNCYECISNFDCLENNDPQALKDLSKYGLPGHKWLKVKDASDPINHLFYEKYNSDVFSFKIIGDIVYIKYQKITLSKEDSICKLREDRDKILASTDWTQLPDINLPEYDKLRYLKYRQNLRDLPNKYLASGQIEWPIL
jgi:hypothetical protein